MSEDFLSQEEIDRFVLGETGQWEEVPLCETCRRPTKRLFATGHGTVRLRVVNELGYRTYRGRLVSGTMFCFGCGSFFNGGIGVQR